RTKLHVTSAFLWAKRDLGENTPAAPPSDLPWLVFCSPPYALFIDRQEEMLALIERIQSYAPPASLLVVEADDRFDFGRLPQNSAKTEAPGDDQSSWDVREYTPAVVGIWRQK